MWEHNKQIPKSIGRMMFLMVICMAIISCQDKSKTIVKEEYQLGNTLITSQLNARHFYLPNYIEFNLDIESNETITPQVSLDKSYKKHFNLEHYNKYTTVGSEATKLMHHYEFVFLAQQADTLWFPGFRVQQSGNAELTTDSTQIIITSVLPNRDAALLPIISKLPRQRNMGLWITLILLLVGSLLWYRNNRKRAFNTKLKEPNATLLLIKAIDDIGNQDLDPSQFDFKVKAILNALESRLFPNQYQDILSTYNKLYTEESFAHNHQEKLRQEKLISFLKDKLSCMLR